MELKSCCIKESVIRNYELTKYIDNIQDIKQFYSKEYDRKYDVYIIKSNEVEYVLKSNKNSYEANAIKLLKKSGINFIPEIKCGFECDDKNWLLMDKIDAIKIEEHHLEKTMDCLSDLHLKFRLINNAVRYPNFKSWNSIEINLDLFSDVELTLSDKQCVVYSNKRLEDSFTTIIHNDMITFNILASEDSVSIIDWEYAMYAPYILDLGRLFGDFNKKEKWIEPKLHKMLLDRYHSNIVAGGIDINREEFNLDLLCAKLYNYLGIVYSHKKNSWEESDWYFQNLNEMKEIIQVLNNNKL
ncbi:MAG: methylthioribose kinase [Candidatus Izimaplasma bacterium HR2]|nr:MAG: methylthioribose kinase [Candidatus Izimaplasma bacterium HR2]